MTDWGAEELRRAALASLGEHGDERARDALVHATLVVTPAVARWESSEGSVEGHHVTLGVDAGTLGTLRAAPSLVDSLCASLAAAIATRPGKSLHDLLLRWAPSARPSSTGYRDAPPPSPETSLHEALVAYLRASGDGALAQRVGEATVDTANRPVVIVRMEGLRGDGYALDRLERALRDLLDDPVLLVRAR